eukprot:15366882-Ditylum_brightwellii.AAC.1
MNLVIETPDPIIALCTSDSNCNDGIDYTDDTCNMDTGQCDSNANDSHCDDGICCNGVINNKDDEADNKDNEADSKNKDNTDAKLPLPGALGRRADCQY